MSWGKCTAWYYIECVFLVNKKAVFLLAIVYKVASILTYKYQFY